MASVQSRNRRQHVTIPEAALDLGQPRLDQLPQPVLDFHGLRWATPTTRNMIKNGRHPTTNQNHSVRTAKSELPTAPMDWTTPAYRQESANARKVHRAPWSMWKVAPARLPHVRYAAARGLVTRSVRMWSAIARPTRRREQRCITVAT